jgi:hypothetical protein
MLPGGRTRLGTSLALVILLMLSHVQLASAYVLFSGKQPYTCTIKYSYRGIADATYRSAFNNGRWAWNGVGSPAPCWQEVADGSWDMGLMLVNDNSIPWDGYVDNLPSNNYNPYSFSYVELNRFYTDAYSSAKKQSVTAHEVGHAWGIAHPASDGQQLMNSHTCGTNSRWCSFSINVPKTDDINAWNAKY